MNFNSIQSQFFTEKIRKLNVALYVRLSEEDRNKRFETDDSNSIQNQKAMLLQYAMEQGWEVYDIYNDDDYTGSDRKRPAFNRLLKDAEEHKFDVILCKTQSRFTRELELVEKYIHGLFPLWGIRFIGIVDNADTANKGNKKSRQINGLVNEWYLEDMSENIRSVLTNRRLNGFHIGAFAPYGYMKDPHIKGHLIIDEEAAAVVKEVFNMFVNGYGKTAIARSLNDRGIPNPTEYKRLRGLRYKRPTMKNSTLWKYFAISDMLVNEVYIGNMVQGKSGSISYKTKINKPRPKSEWYRVENTHEPIIEQELWDRAQELIKQRAKPFNVGKIGIFARKVRCANCGYIMRNHKSRKEYYLQCSNRHVSKDSCIGAFISVKRLEKIVLEELRKLYDKYIDNYELEQKIECCANLQSQKQKILSDILNYKRKIDECSKGIKELYIDKVKGIISENDYLEFSKDFKFQKNRLEGIVLEGESAISEIDIRIQQGDDRRCVIEKYANTEHLTREMVDTLIDYITVDKRIPGTRNVPVVIHWNF